MKVKEYLIKRIEELEKDLKHVRNEYAGTKYGLGELQKEVVKLNEKIEQYEIEREHIKEIITCNIVDNVYSNNVKQLILYKYEDDFKTLMAILDIKPEDYETVHPECSEPCTKCEYADFTNGKCTYKEEDDAETKD